MALSNYGYGSSGGMQGFNDDGSGGNYNPRIHYQAAKLAGFELRSVDEQPRTIYVGNLDLSITEDFLQYLFSHVGTVRKTKIILDVCASPYAFVEFQDHVVAAQCVACMNNRLLANKNIKVNWATEHHGSQLKVDTSNHFHVFVGDLSPEVDNRVLQETFARFGEISDVKVIRDVDTLKSKGYGFVSYPIREQAERAIEQMNGQWVGKRPIRTNWATRKPVVGESSQYNSKPTLDEVMNQSTASNTSVYVGNLSQKCSEVEVRQAFMQFGDILDIRHFNTLRYAFVRFSTNQAAARAIIEMNGADFMGQSIRCSWGKSDGGNSVAGRPDLMPQSYTQGPPSFVVSSSASIANVANMQDYVKHCQQYYNSNPQQIQQWQGYWKSSQSGNKQ